MSSLLVRIVDGFILAVVLSLVVGFASLPSFNPDLFPNVVSVLVAGLVFLSLWHAFAGREAWPFVVLHIGVAAVHGMEYLVTWNCRHIANAWMRSQIEEVIRELG